jgi:hypothetical protein
MGMLIEIVLGALRGSGNSDIAEWIEDAPEQAGKLIGSIILDAMDGNGKISAGAVSKLRELMVKHPAKTHAEPQPKTTVEWYLKALKALVAAVCPYKLIAMNGFLHTKDCLILLHVRDAAKLEITRVSGDSEEQSIWLSEGTSGGLDVAVLRNTPATEADLVEINKEIAQDPAAYWKSIQTKIESDVLKITNVLV